MAIVNVVARGGIARPALADRLRELAIREDRIRLARDLTRRRAQNAESAAAGHPRIEDQRVGPARAHRVSVAFVSVHVATTSKSV